MPGNFPPTIIVGVIVSVFSLAWGSSRAFFIERTRDEADPDPAVPMVVLWVFPCMLLIAINSMMMWTLTGGILGKTYTFTFLTLQNVFLGPWVFLAMLLQFIVNVVVVTLVIREFCKDTSAKPPKDQEQTTKAGMEMISVGASSPEEALADHQGGKHEMESKPLYELKAALTAMWLPAVVGDKRNMFIAASLSTLITKILMLLVSVILVYFFQEKVHSHPFVLWSKVGKSPNLLLANQVPIFSFGKFGNPFLVSLLG